MPRKAPRFWVWSTGEFTAHFGRPILVVGLVDVHATIWILSHGHLGAQNFGARANRRS